MATTRTLVTESGQGSALTEAVLQTHYNAMRQGASYIVSGYELSDPTGLFVDIAAGDAWVNGYFIDQTTAQTGQALTSSSTNYIWLPPSGTIEIETTGTATDSDSLLIGTAVTDGSGITALSHQVDVTNGHNIVRLKPSNEAFTSAADDTDLTFTASAGEVWEIRAVLRIGATTNAGGDVVIKIPSGTMSMGAMAPGAELFSSASAQGGGYVRTYQHTTSTTNIGPGWIYDSGTTAGSVYLSGIAYIGSAGGAVSLRFQQNVSTFTVYAGSVLIARRIAG